MAERLTGYLLHVRIAWLFRADAVQSVVRMAVQLGITEPLAMRSAWLASSSGRSCWAAEPGLGSNQARHHCRREERAELFERRLSLYNETLGRSMSVSAEAEGTLAVKKKNVTRNPNSKSSLFDGPRPPALYGFPKTGGDTDHHTIED